LLSLSGCATDNIVDTEDHLGSFGSGDQGLLLDTEALSDTHFLHVVNLTFDHVDTGINVAFDNVGTELGDELSGIVATVFTDNSGELSQGTGESFASDSLLASHGLGELVDGEGHSHFGVTTTEDDFVVLASGDQDANGVVKGTLSFVENVLAGATEYDGTSLVLVATGELNHLVFTDHDLLDLVAGAKNIGIGAVKSGQNLGAEDGGESLNTIKVSVLNNHNAGTSEELLGVVVNKLSINEDIGLVGKNFVDFSLHLSLLSFLNFTDLLHRVDLDLGAHNLDLVVIEGGVGNHNLGSSGKSLATGGDGLLEDHTVSKEGVTEGATSLLDKLNVVHVT